LPPDSFAAFLCYRCPLVASCFLCCLPLLLMSPSWCKSCFLLQPRQKPISSGSASVRCLLLPPMSPCFSWSLCMFTCRLPPVCFSASLYHEVYEPLHLPLQYHRAASLIRAITPAFDTDVAAAFAAYFRFSICQSDVLLPILAAYFRHSCCHHLVFLMLSIRICLPPAFLGRFLCRSCLLFLCRFPLPFATCSFGGFPCGHLCRGVFFCRPLTSTLPRSPQPDMTLPYTTHVAASFSNCCC
jgi:hypothetical protein